jgi:hypothetical protein
MKTNAYLWSYPAQFFLEWEMFQTSGLSQKVVVYWESMMEEIQKFNKLNLLGPPDHNG